MDIAKALVTYYLGLSLGKANIPRSALHYCWRRLSYSALSNISLSGYYAVDETKILLVNGLMYYFWVVRDANTGFVPFFMLTEARSGLDVAILVNNMRSIEVKVLAKELDDYYIHDGLPAYNHFSHLNIKHVRFRKRNVVEQVFRSIKHRLSVMDFHFPWTSSKTSLKAWFDYFLLIFNLTLSVYKR